MKEILIYLTTSIKKRKKEKKKPNKKTHTIESKWKEATNPRD